jgi:DNA mismatch endonuclease, patch repair protein
MQANKSHDTVPEKALRSAIHRMGLRYRVGIRPVKQIRRTGDLVFTRARVVVLVDGCFWHGCPEHYTIAKTNAEYWAGKLQENQVRDRETDRLFTEAGWQVIRVWEHEDPELAAQRISVVVHHASPARPGSGDDGEHQGDDGPSKPAKRGRRMPVECACQPEPRRLQLTPKQIEDGPIICGLCCSPFELREDNQVPR